MQGWVWLPTSPPGSVGTLTHTRPAHPGGIGFTPNGIVSTPTTTAPYAPTRGRALGCKPYRRHFGANLHADQSQLWEQTPRKNASAGSGRKHPQCRDSPASPR